MDKFEKTMELLAGASEKERSKFVFENRHLCVCHTCRTYNECAMNAKEALYCMTGESPTCIKEKKICACSRCPVHFSYGLTKYFSCLRGAEIDQRTKK
jgi:hypothetical protein